MRELELKVSRRRGIHGGLGDCDLTVLRIGVSRGQGALQSSYGRDIQLYVPRSQVRSMVSSDLPAEAEKIRKVPRPAEERCELGMLIDWGGRERIGSND